MIDKVQRKNQYYMDVGWMVVVSLLSWFDPEKSTIIRQLARDFYFKKINNSNKNLSHVCIPSSKTVPIMWCVCGFEMTAYERCEYLYTPGQCSLYFRGSFLCHFLYMCQIVLAHSEIDTNAHMNQRHRRCEMHWCVLIMSPLKMYSTPHFEKCELCHDQSWQLHLHRNREPHFIVTMVAMAWKSQFIPLYVRGCTER